MKTQFKAELKQEEELREFKEQAEAEIGGLKVALENLRGEIEELHLLAQESKCMLREKTERLEETEKLQDLWATVKEQKRQKGHVQEPLRKLQPLDGFKRQTLHVCWGGHSSP